LIAAFFDSADVAGHGKASYWLTAGKIINET